MGIERTSRATDADAETIEDEHRVERRPPPPPDQPGAPGFPSRRDSYAAARVATEQASQERTDTPTKDVPAPTETAGALMTTPPQPMMLEYGEGPKEVHGIATVDQLDAELDRITAEAHTEDLPCVVNLISPAGRVLSMGAGADVSILSWTDEAADHPYLLSQGDSAGITPVEFFYGNQMSEFPPTAVIPVHTARQAMREFFTTNRLPTSVKWTE